MTDQSGRVSSRPRVVQITFYDLPDDRENVLLDALSTWLYDDYDEHEPTISATPWNREESDV